MSKQRWAKRKGTQGERDLINLFWENNWSAHRIAGSGSSRYPSPDVIAGIATRKIAIEAKVCNDKKKYFTEEEIYGLKEFCRIFGAEAWIAIKFWGEEWMFITLEDLNESGKSYNASIQDMKNKGLLFEELIK